MIRPASASRCRIHAKTASCVSTSINRRVREIVECIGRGSEATQRTLRAGTAEPRVARVHPRLLLSDLRSSALPALF
jgi:hypothetical protein